MAETTVVPNGLDGATGRYLLPTLDAAQLAGLALGQPIDTPEVRERTWWHRQHSKAVFGVAEGIDPSRLDEAGWGLIAAPTLDDSVLEALGPLRRLRREQARAGGHDDYYQEFVGDRAYRPGESKQAFLTRLGVGPGPANPASGVPYYLLIVGDPESIPFSFQYQLDVAYAVGRVSFERPEEYARYAASVVDAESRRPQQEPGTIAFFAPTNAGDRATELSTARLVTPLSEAFTDSEWAVRSYLDADATKARLLDLVGGTDRPDLLFTASHGVGYRQDDPRQRGDQGALVCQDWPGPHGGGLLPDHYLAAHDIDDDISPQGSVVFSFACFGAGTPRMDDFTRSAFSEPTEVASRAFVAKLPQRLLAHPEGGALAFVGHVERAWAWSFSWEGTSQIETFRGALSRVMTGQPIGSAMEYFNQKYAELSSDITSELEEIRNYGKIPDELALADLWLANNDARSYVVIGDPAVRLPGRRAKEQAR